mgnify:CR=1 FL=1|jgi:hypothetical protein
MGNSWAREREIIPTIGGNDTAPADEQVRVYFKPFAVREKGPFVKGLMQIARAVVDESTELQQRLKAAQDAAKAAEEGGDDAPDVDQALLDEVLESADEQKAKVLEYVFQRVTRGERGADRVDGRAEVWERVSDDDDLVDEICGAILDSAGMGKDNRPF